MPFESKLVLFLVTVVIAIATVSRFPNWGPSRWLLSWHGPTEVFGESRARYLARWAGYSLRFVVLFGVALGVAIPFMSPRFGPMPGSIAIFIVFVLPLCLGTALLATLGFAIRAVWALATSPPDWKVPRYGEVEQDASTFLQIHFAYGEASVDELTKVMEALDSDLEETGAGRLEGHELARDHSHAPRRARKA